MPVVAPEERRLHERETPLKVLPGDFDRAALRAVRNSRLPPLPSTFSGRVIGVHYHFEFDAMR